MIDQSMTVRGLALSAAVAFGVHSTTPALAASVPESQDPIIIGKLDWVGQEITAEVAGEILRRMGYNVDFVQATQVPLFQAVADGEISVYLENWNQVSKKYYDEYTADGRIEPLGETGLRGSEGRGRGAFRFTAEDQADLRAIAAATRGAGKVLGLPAPEPAAYALAVAEGAGYVTVCDDLTALRLGFAQGLEVAKQARGP